MAQFATENIRTVALVGHGGVGQDDARRGTAAQVRGDQAPGSVERGTTVSDFDPLEKTYQHSLRASVAALRHGGHARPPDRHAGLPRFHRPGDRRARRGRDGGGRRQRAGGPRDDHVADDGLGGASASCAGSSSSTRSTPRTSICRQLLAAIQAAFGRECLPINLPADGGKHVVDCFFNPVGRIGFLVGRRRAPRARRPGGRGRRGADVALSRAGRDRSRRSCTRRSRRRCAKATSCRSASSRRAPAPASPSCSTDLRRSCCPIRPKAIRRCSTRARATSREEFRSVPDPKKHVLAHVFKVVVDPFVGKLGVFRVHQGTVTKDTQLFIGERPQVVQGRPPLPAAGRQERRDRSRRARRHRRGGEGRRDRVRLRAARLARRGPHPHAAARVPGADARRRDHAEKARRRAADLRRAAPDDRRGSDASSLEHDRDDSTRRCCARWASLHLRSVLERMAAQFKVEIDTRPPRIPYRETITAKAEGFHRHKKQTGGAGQFGEVSLRVEPRERGAGFEFVDATKGGVDSASVHARGAEGRRAGARHRRGRRLSAAGRARHRLRRQASSGRLEGSRVRQRRQEGVSRRGREGAARSCSSRSSASRSSVPT